MIAVPGAYYNENDPKAAAWLRELIAEGVIAPGDVDERSITEIKAHELDGYTQCHFFAGIGGWSLALRLAGWPDSVPVWTGSCPCQPFSGAGKQRAERDERHLWPEFRRLIAEWGPSIVFGEQVASALGRVWLAGIRADLEALGYGFGGADLCAAGVGAPHMRQRLYWVANAECGELRAGRGEHRGEAGPQLENGIHAHGCVGECDRGDAAQADAWNGDHGDQPGRNGADSSGSTAASRRPWDSFDRLPCLDGKKRRVESGTFPLADGVPGRVGLLRGYGNAIVAPLAAEFIQASVEALSGIT